MILSTSTNIVNISLYVHKQRITDIEKGELRGGGRDREASSMGKG
jgi:hypothetical protein